MANNNRINFINESILKSAELIKNGFLCETVTFTAEENTSVTEASKNPLEWSTWANRNPHDSLRIWILWKSQNLDVSKLVQYYKPNLTPCETFPNALGYAIHLGLKRFFFSQREYSTTPINGGSSQTSYDVNANSNLNYGNSTSNVYTAKTVTNTNQTTNKENIRNSIIQKYNNAIKNADKQELNAAYKEARESGFFTPQELGDLRNARFHGKRAITNQKYADRQTEKGRDEMAAKDQNRVNKHLDKMNQKLTNATKE